MATEKQLAAVRKMQEAKKRKALEREQQKAVAEQGTLIEEQEEEVIEEDSDLNDSEYYMNNDISIGFKIDEELNDLWKDNIRELSSSELKQKARTTYDLIFQSYEEGKKNGVETSYYLMIEEQPHKYILKKL